MSKNKNLNFSPEEVSVAKSVSELIQNTVERSVGYIKSHGSDENAVREFLTKEMLRIFAYSMVANDAFDIVSKK